MFLCLKWPISITVNKSFFHLGLVRLFINWQNRRSYHISSHFSEIFLFNKFSNKTIVISLMGLKYFLSKSSNSSSHINRCCSLASIFFNQLIQLLSYMIWSFKGNVSHDLHHRVLPCYIDLRYLFCYWFKLPCSNFCHILVRLIIFSVKLSTVFIESFIPRVWIYLYLGLHVSFSLLNLIWNFNYFRGITQRTPEYMTKTS
jgi:hypothetical protein